jgi:L-iditol 2-dehydrogenase
MWAYQVGAPGQLERIDVEKPSEAELAHGEIIIRLISAGICGSDIPKFRGRVNPVDPVVGFPLHELCGEVVATADPNHRLGTRVVGMALNSQGFSEFVKNPGNMFHAVDDTFEDVRATVIQPMATVLNAIAQIPDPAGKHVAVIGQGPLGVLFTHVLKSRGAATVTGVDRVDRRDFGSQFGVDNVVWKTSDRWAREIDPHDQPEIIVEAVGHQPSTINDAIEAAAFGGFIFAFGVPDDTHYPIAFQRMFRKSITLLGGVTSDYQRFLKEAEDYLVSHPELPDAYVTDVYSFDDAQSGFERYAEPTVGRMKVVLTYT